MEKRNYIKLLATLLLVACFFSFAGCNKKVDQKKEKTKSPTAQAKQAIRTPVLIAPEPKVEEKKPPKNEDQAVVDAKPRGPITLPPTNEQQASQAAEASLATLTGQKSQKPGNTEDLQSLAAPSVKPGEIEKVPEDALPVPYQPKLVSAKTNIDIILDASGSMAAPLGGTSQSKFEIMREALYEVIYEALQQQADFPRNFAIRLFGSKSSTDDDNCDDTELLVPMGEPELDIIKGMLDSAKPQGKSPIALAIRNAQKDFPSDGQADRVIVLLADGADNCDEDPCSAARKIEHGTLGYVINTIAFDVTGEDQKKLECITKTGSGKFFLARNENELRTALNEAINSTVPYNLKLSARAGATPLPFNLKVLSSKTQRVIKKDKSLGTKMLSLKPGTYDILIEYAESPEMKKPSKILKGVEVIQSTRVEQTVNFDLGQLSVSAVSNEGKLVPARFEIIPTKDGKQTGAPALLEIGAESKSVFLTPGSYDVVANLVELTPDDFSIVEKNVAVTKGGTIDKLFKFQKGTLTLKALTTQDAETPFIFQAYKVGRTNIPIASGAFNKSGGKVLLAPGTYDILAIGTDDSMAASPRTRVKAVEIKAAENKDVSIKFEMSKLTLAAVDGKNNKLPAEFIIREHESGTEMTKLKSESGSPVSVPLPPGNYDIVAVSLKSTIEPRPSVPVPTISLTVKNPIEKTIKFILGTLRLRGRNAKELPINTQFTIYKSASDEIISSAPPSTDWVLFDIAPGIYDALAIDITPKKDPKPMIWLRDLKVEDGKSSSHEAIYTTGKIKVIGRGPNNKIIECKFKVFQYGADRELVSGVTGDDWEIFEIEPGKYYLEASYVDEIEAVTLKKWINVTVGDNEVVEQILRF
ncbi:MAG: VWA domain-containing protein [Deltaproteobacteria bacterium]|jgi:uncharacterized protein with GYD domain|nr:VWA domain-containing protein [Deltaproteobacteria bacterium]